MQLRNPKTKNIIKDATLDCKIIPESKASREMLKQLNSRVEEMRTLSADISQIILNGARKE